MRAPLLRIGARAPVHRPMAKPRFLMLAVFLLLGGVAGAHDDKLAVGFYRRTCPGAEAVVRKVVFDAYRADPTVTAPLLRLHFHDCFVRGCDGSVLINSTKTEVAEKDAKPNLTLDGFDVIDAAKEAVEAKCPGVVSCADIVAIAARDAVSLAAAAGTVGRRRRRPVLSKEGHLYEVETGRRDGVVSSAAEALKNLPSPFFGIAELKKMFHSKGLSLKDLAALSGAHAIGNAHCFSFARRLSNFSAAANLNVDPTIDPVYAAELRPKCKAGDNVTQFEMVPGSSTTFDVKYYALVVERRGLFHSDEALLLNRATKALVRAYKNSERRFFSDFGASMVNMGRVGVLTGGAGEIRRECAVFNGGRSA